MSKRKGVWAEVSLASYMDRFPAQLCSLGCRSAEKILNRKENSMPEFGIIAIPTHYTIKPVELGRWAEVHGFESLWMGEHSHIPTSRQSQFPLGGDCRRCTRSSSIRLSG
jgi:hypothetical protein